MHDHTLANGYMYTCLYEQFKIFRFQITFTNLQASAYISFQHTTNTLSPPWLRIACKAYTVEPAI